MAPSKLKIRRIATLAAAGCAGFLLAQSPAWAQAEDFPIEAGSWGGKVRSGPGTSFKRLEGLQEGEAVTLLENTGVLMNGYPWFKVRYRGGKTGYKWGGILCARNIPVKGVFRHCDGYKATAAATTAPAAKPAKSADTAKPAEDTASGTQSAADDELKWSHRQFDDPKNKGQKTSTLTYGVPETDDIQLRATCSAGSSGTFSIMELSADTDKLLDTTQVKVKFSNQSKSHVLDATVQKHKKGEGIAGVLIYVENDDTLWQSLQELPFIDYQVNKFKSASLELEGAKKQISDFVAECRSYAGKFDADPDAETAETDPVPPTPAKDISEKEAFDSAKELDTAEAWEAFLRNFPEGFRADLARAYVKRLRGGASSGSDTASTEQTPTQDTPTEQTMETVDLGPGTSSWRTFKYQMDEGNASAPAAGVEAKGLELLMFCTNKQVAAILRDCVVKAC